MQNKTITPAIAGKKRILFATVPADGHFNPLTGLAHFLQESGYSVGWYASSVYSEKIQKAGIKHFPFKKALEVTGTNIEQVFPQRSKIRNVVKKLNFDIINFFILRSEEYYADIQDIRTEFPFDLVITDVAFSAIPFIKDKMNIPVISIGVFPLTESSKDLPPTGLGMTPSYTIGGKIKQSALRFFADNVLFRKANAVMKEVMTRNDISYVSTNVFDLLVKKSSLVLQIGTPGFEYKRSDMGDNIRFIGSLLPAGKSHSGQWFDNRLNKYERIVLVTQGTVEKDIEKLLVPTLEAFKNSDTLIVATTGGSGTQELKSKYPHQNFIIEDFIPFSDVMPYADVYITNGGFGGVMLSVSNNLPMVAAGVHEGKNEINARIGYFGLGINLHTEKPGPAEIRSAVDAVISDKRFRKNVIKLSEELSGYDTFTLCREYIEELTITNRRIISDHVSEAAL